MSHSLHLLSAVLVLLVCLAPPPAVLATQASTLAFLQQFRNAFSDVLGSSWTGTNYCNNWRGVTCVNGNTANVRLDLSGANLYGTLPEPDVNLMGTVDISEINLNNNPGIYGSLPTNWNVLRSSLTKLYLSYLSISGPIPTTFNALSLLTDMTLTNTGICGRVTPLNLPEMQRIDYRNNNFTSSLPYYWGYYDALQSAQMDGNQWCGCIPVEWRNSSLLISIAPPATLADDCETSNACPVGYNEVCEVSNDIPVRSTTAQPSSPSPQPPSPTPQQTTAAPVTSTNIFTATEIVYTARFLTSFRAAIPALVSIWNGNDFCQYRGIQCIAATRSIRINLHSWGVRGTLPAVDANSIIGSAVRVTSIDVGGNTGIVGGFPVSWAYLPYLQDMDLSNTGLSGTLPFDWATLPLRIMLLNNAGVRGPLPAWQHGTMYYLDVSDNGFRSALPPTWAEMTGISALKLTGNSLCGCLPASWTYVPVMANAALAANSVLGSSQCAMVNSCTPTTTTTRKPVTIIVSSAPNKPALMASALLPAMVSLLLAMLLV